MFRKLLNIRTYWSLGISAILLYMIPYIVLGEDAYITIHDFLDSNVAHQCTIIQQGLVGDPDGIVPVMGGIPSLNYISLIPLDTKTLLYIILPTYWAIVINIFFVKIGAFVGMSLLLTNYINKQYDFKVLFVSICFSLIPFYVDYGWSAAGVPLFSYAALNLENNKKILLSYVIIILFGINSSLALSGLFICIIWCGYIVHKWRCTRGMPKLHILGILLLGIVYLFTNVSILYDFFFPSNIISHRVEFGSAGDIWGILKMFVGYVFLSQYHAGAFGAFIIIGIITVVICLKREVGSSMKFYFRLYLLILSLIALGCLMRIIPVSSSFQFDRFYFLYPSICFILLAKALSLISLKRRKILAVVIGGLVMGSVLSFDKEAIVNGLKIITGYEMAQKPSYREFVDKELFDTIKRDLGMKKPFEVKVSCVGMFPSVAEMNQFYTIDSYVYSYPLDYKHRFRKVIAPELKKNETLRDYFDEWGSRCYIFSSELDQRNNRYLCSKKEHISIAHLDINTEELKALGCEYVFSAVDIMNYRDLNLDYIDSYTTDESYWNLRVYKLL